MQLSYRLLSGKFIRKENGIKVRYVKGNQIDFDDASFIPEALKDRLKLISPMTAEMENRLNSEDEFFRPGKGLKIQQILIDLEPTYDDEPKNAVHIGADLVAYNIINQNTGTPLNDVPLSEEEAIAVVGDDNVFEIGGEGLDTLVFRDAKQKRKYTKRS